VKETGRKAGLWLAPLLVVPSSSVYKNHRDWLLHDKTGKLVSAGFNWGEQLYALDTTHPSALNWLVDLMLKVRQWGYEYVKLDFLYAGALPGKRYVDIPRETAYRLGLNSMRKALKSVYLLACGAPILPSIGVCDGIRIGPDVAEYFTSHLADNLLMNFAFPGVRNVLRTSVNRLWLQHLVHIDPDVVYFRSCQNKLTPIEKSVLQDLAYICNFKACSDIPAWLTYLERSTLKEFLENKPISHQTGRTTFQIGTRKVDFSQYISMPPSPNKFTNLLGVLIGRLADIPSIVNAFDLLGKYSRFRILRQNPV
jgi:alpha-galactosidase